MDWSKIYDSAVAWAIRTGPRILLAIIIFIVGQWFIRLLRKWTHRSLEKKNFAPSLRPFILSLLFTTMQALLILAILQVLGIQMSIFAALIAAVGVAAGLALSGTLQNFTSGILILVLKPYKMGDNIASQGQEGTVTSIQLFYTIITTYDNKSVIIPNSKLSNELIVNISQVGSRRMDTALLLPFSIPFDTIKPIIENSIQRNGNILKEPASRIGISEIRETGYTVMINLWVAAHGFQDETMAFRETLLAAITSAGFVFPEP